MASSPFLAATIVSSGSHLGAQVTRVWSGPSGWLDVASYPIDLYVLRWVCKRLLRMSVSDHCTSHCCWAPALPLPALPLPALPLGDACLVLVLDFHRLDVTSVELFLQLCWASECGVWDACALGALSLGCFLPFCDRGEWCVSGGVDCGWRALLLWVCSLLLPDGCQFVVFVCSFGGGSSVSWEFS